jgi:3-methyladenine DNA glycosylase AlkD
MPRSTLVHHLETSFKTASDASIAAKQSAYMRNLFPFLGVQKPLKDQLQRPIFKEHCPTHEKELINTLKILWDQEAREYQYSACDLAIYAKKLWTPAIFATFEKMIRQKSWWDTVDDIAANLIGKLLLKHPELVTTMDDWIQDECLWIRRTALIYQLTWKQETDAGRLLRYCETTMHEKDFFIRKAIGWALRQYSKTQPQVVKKFIQKNRSSLSPLSIREGSKYL